MKTAKPRRITAKPFLVPFLIVIVVIVVVVMTRFMFDDYVIHNQDQHYPVLAKNSDLKIELVTSKLSFPTNMAFLDHHNILVLEKNTGAVRLISDGVLREKPLLRLNVDSKGERGLLGLAILNNTSVAVAGSKEDRKNDSQSSSNISSSQAAYVFLYFTESKKNGEARNVIYRYDWNGTSLINPMLILESPSLAGIYHNGGKIIIGPRDHQLYVVIGDLNAPDSVTQNYKYGKKSNYSSVILRIDPLTGSPSVGNPFISDGHGITDNNHKDLEYCYAYGIRNSFGLSFDSVTGILWDTENGENTYDEINTVKPGFNSGWDKVMGPISRNNNTSIESKLFDLPGSYYSDPRFSWRIPIGVTAIEFFNSSIIGKEYKNNIFVGDINNGNIYYFRVNNKNRTTLIFGNDTNTAKQYSDLNDLVADSKKETLESLFATNFEGRITDIKTGPDGFLYVLTYFDGKIYRIMPK